MIDRKKVCKGLYAHGYKDCKSCPYWGSGPHGSSECKDLAREALSLLREQEPRVMTLKEVKNLQSLRDGAIWLEALSGLFPALPEICMLNTTFFVAIPLNNYRGHFDNKYYGKTWRCWTARPTDEQREAAKWND